MEKGTNELVSVEQQLAILQKRLPQDMAVLDSFARCQTILAELVQEITDLKAKANDDLKNLDSVSGNWGQRLAELEEYAQNHKREEFGKQLGDVNSRLENVEHKLRDKLNSKSNDQNLDETKFRDSLEDEESYKKMVSDHFEQLEAKLEREINDLRRLYKQAPTEGQSELSQLRTELEQFKQEQVQLQEQVSQLQSQLSQLQQFQQETIDKPQETVNQRVAEINKTNTDSSVKQPTVCTHGGNPQGNLFCIHCGQPIKVQRTIRQYQVLQTLEQGEMETTYVAGTQRSLPNSERACSSFSHMSLRGCL